MRSVIKSIIILAAILISWGSYAIANQQSLRKDVGPLEFLKQKIGMVTLKFTPQCLEGQTR